MISQNFLLLIFITDQAVEKIEQDRLHGQRHSRSLFVRPSVRHKVDFRAIFISPESNLWYSGVRGITA